MLIMAQMPSFHSLRHINLVSLVLCISYSLCATAGSIYAGTAQHISTQPVPFIIRWQMLDLNE
jgi:hypothetical protein